MKSYNYNGVILLLICFNFSICSLSLNNEKFFNKKFTEGDEFIKESTKLLEDILTTRKEKNLNETDDNIFLSLNEEQKSKSKTKMDKNKCKIKKGTLIFNDKTVKAYLSPKSLKIFKTSSNSSLLLNVQLDKIIKLNPTSKVPEYDCLNIIFKDKNDSKEINLCAGSKSIIKSWLSSINQNRNCNTSSNEKDIVLLDFTSDIKKKATKNKKESKASEDLNNLYYDNDDSDSKKDKEKLNVIENVFSGLLDRLENRKIEKQAIERKLNTKLFQANSITQKLEKKHDLLNQKLEEEYEKDIEEENSNTTEGIASDKTVVKVQSPNNEIDLIKALVEKIDDLKVKLNIIIEN